MTNWEEEFDPYLAEEELMDWLQILQNESPKCKTCRYWNDELHDVSISRKPQMVRMNNEPCPLDEVIAVEIDPNTFGCFWHSIYERLKRKNR